jgi:pantoate kinase
MRPGRSESLRRARAFAPGHVTGFFAIFDAPHMLASRGSIGSGFSVELGAKVEVVGAGKGKKDIKLIVDGKVSRPDDYPVLEYVLSRFKGSGRDLPRGMVVRVKHELPLGAGFGMSAAGALSLAIALDVLATGDDVPSVFAYRTAHEADVYCRTGLGDVVSEAYGGFEVRLMPGISGIIRLLPISGDVYLFARDEGISTKDVLSDDRKRGDITTAGLRSLEEFMKEPTLERFSEISRKFARDSLLSTSEILDLLLLLGPVAHAGMIMLGNSVYAFPRPEKERDCEALAKRIEKQAKWRVWRTKVSKRGAYIISIA